MISPPHYMQTVCTESILSMWAIYNEYNYSLRLLCREKAFKTDSKKSENLFVKRIFMVQFCQSFGAVQGMSCSLGSLYNFFKLEFFKSFFVNFKFNAITLYS